MMEGEQFFQEVASTVNEQHMTSTEEGALAGLYKGEQEIQDDRKREGRDGSTDDQGATEMLRLALVHDHGDVVDFFEHLTDAAEDKEAMTALVQKYLHGRASDEELVELGKRFISWGRETGRFVRAAESSEQ